MKHQPICKWEMTTSEQCEYKDTHHYCQHKEHECTCVADKGQVALISDVEALLKEIVDGEFGDFTNVKYATPKIELSLRFSELKANVIDGKYD